MSVFLDVFLQFKHKLYSAQIFKNKKILGIMILFFLSCPRPSECQNVPEMQLLKWLQTNRHAENTLPISHIGDPRFNQWTITYDAAVVTIAYIALGELEPARKIINYFFNQPQIWRLDGAIEAFIPGLPFQGKDWSVRTGANLWLGLACFHLYKATFDAQYLEKTKNIAHWAMRLQNSDKQDPNWGGLRLGPQGDSIIQEINILLIIKRCRLFTVFILQKLILMHMHY